ncbi:hypothetical protein EI94DRAFT_423408 [Lactarius quietus]|nr:hypothetical protein EI94DRAFT_423408 [Lactarius quietus]
MARADNEHCSTGMDGDHTREQLVNWLMSKNSVATCFIKDVLSMSEIEGRGLPHYLLGRVPCRSVTVVAIIVEATAYDNRDLYTRCSRESNERKTGHTLPEPSKKRSSSLIPVGSVVRVQGRVRAKWNSREIYGESIERCQGPGVELDHWRQVVALHEKHYFVPEKFVVPSSPSAVAFGAQDVPRTRNLQQRMPSLLHPRLAFILLHLPLLR